MIGDKYTGLGAYDIPNELQQAQPAVLYGGLHGNVDLTFSQWHPGATSCDPVGFDDIRQKIIEQVDKTISAAVQHLNSGGSNAILSDAKAVDLIKKEEALKFYYLSFIAALDFS
ncbi:hypothetical protein FS837_012203 [Tulasnella sp. UAMH 9824]|nr:hypothetical protein FS837_012203 [Tulasnella sp. UAMH 9824]